MRTTAEEPRVPMWEGARLGAWSKPTEGVCMRTIATLVCTCWLLWPAVLSAIVTVGEVRLPEELVVAGHPLVLNGYGVRTAWLTPLYVVALYLPQRSAEVRYIQDAEVPKALRVEVAYGGSHPSDVPANWQAELYPQLTGGEITQLQQAYAGMTKGDVLLISYEPGRGTHMQLNERPLIATHGPGLMTAFLDLWIGAHPVSQDLRRLLLDRAAD